MVKILREDSRGSKLEVKVEYTTKEHINELVYKIYLIIWLIKKI